MMTSMNEMFEYNEKRKKLDCFYTNLIAMEAQTYDHGIIPFDIFESRVKAYFYEYIFNLKELCEKNPGEVFDEAWDIEDMANYVKETLADFNTVHSKEDRRQYWKEYRGEYGYETELLEDFVAEIIKDSRIFNITPESLKHRIMRDRQDLIDILEKFTGYDEMYINLRANLMEEMIYEAWEDQERDLYNDICDEVYEEFMKPVEVILEIKKIKLWELFANVEDYMQWVKSMRCEADKRFEERRVH